MRNWKKILAVCCICAVSLAVGASVKMRQVVRKIVHPKVEQIKESVEYDRMTGNVNLLLVGEDNVEGSRRSDTVAFIAIDLNGKTVRLLSLPRDTRAEIPGHGWQKLNHSFAYGGVDLLQSTVSRLIGMPIHYYIVVDYDSFPKLVDLLGGVDIQVEKRLHYTDRAAKLYIDIPAGKQHLDGVRALHFVRFRHDALGDIGRVHRQQQFLKALLARMRAPQNMSRVTDLAREMISEVQTDLSTQQAIQLAGFVRDMDRQHILFQMLPGKPVYLGGLSYWQPDIASAGRYLTASADQLISEDRLRQKDRLFAVSSASDIDENGETSGDRGTLGPASEAIVPLSPVPSPSLLERDPAAWIRNFPEAVAILNGNGVSGVSGQAAEKLQRIGIDVIYMGNAKHYDYRYSNVLFPLNATNAQIRAAKMLAELCAIPPNLVRPSRQAVYASLVLGKDYGVVLDRLARFEQAPR